MLNIETISQDLAEELCRKITADLPQYFGLPEVNEHYATGVRSNLNFAAKVGSEYIGLISINFPYPQNANIYWMGVLGKFHNTGIGKKLSNYAFHEVKNKGAKTISVETLAPKEADESYLKTYNFYKHLGFSPLFNLKPDGYEWNMVYMLKHINTVTNTVEDVLIRPLEKKDTIVIAEAFTKIGWDKQSSIYEQYLKETDRNVWVAFLHGTFVGYITLKLNSKYQFFKEQNIPEIMDLNVLPEFRKMGIGSLLLDTAEKEAAKKNAVVGIGVGLYDDYGSAQRMYIKRGYIPDGKGVTYNYEQTTPGKAYALDDDFVLWFSKKLAHNDTYNAK